MTTWDEQEHEAWLLFYSVLCKHLDNIQMVGCFGSLSLLRHYPEEFNS